jgi:hypothetical protein
MKKHSSILLFSLMVFANLTFFSNVMRLEDILSSETVVHMLEIMILLIVELINIFIITPAPQLTLR